MPTHHNTAKRRRAGRRVEPKWRSASTTVVIGSASAIARKNGGIESVGT